MNTTEVNKYSSFANTVEHNSLISCYITRLNMFCQIDKGLCRGYPWSKEKLSYNGILSILNGYSIVVCPSCHKELAELAMEMNPLMHYLELSSKIDDINIKIDKILSLLEKKK